MSGDSVKVMLFIIADKSPQHLLIIGYLLGPVTFYIHYTIHSLQYSFNKATWTSVRHYNLTTAKKEFRIFSHKATLSQSSLPQYKTKPPASPMGRLGWWPFLFGVFHKQLLGESLYRWRQWGSEQSNPLLRFLQLEVVGQGSEPGVGPQLLQHSHLATQPKLLSVAVNDTVVLPLGSKVRQGLKKGLVGQSHLGSNPSCPSLWSLGREPNLSRPQFPYLYTDIIRISQERHKG